MTEIRPRFSLLFADQNRTPEEKYSKELLAFLEPLPVDDAARPTLEKVLSLGTDRKDILYRKEILEDFLQSPSLLEKCESVCRKWEGLYEKAATEKDAPADTTYQQALEALRANTVSLMEHLHFFRRAAEEMKSETPTSGGLFFFSEFLRQHASSPAVRELTEQIGNYPLLNPNTAKAVLQIHCDDTGAQTVADLRYLGNDDGKYLKKHPQKKDVFSADMPKDRAPEQTVQAVIRLSAAFRTLTAQIRESFLPLKEGLTFYHFALSLTEWAERKGFSWTFPLPSAPHGPVGKGIRNLGELSGTTTQSPLTLTARPREFFGGEWGTEVLKTIARTQVLAAAGLPVIASQVSFCPEETVVLYDSQGKTVEEEIAALAEIFHHTKKNDVILLNHPLVTVARAPAKEILDNLLSTFLKKGASVRLATTWSVEEIL